MGFLKRVYRMINKANVRHNGPSYKNVIFIFNFFVKVVGTDTYIACFMVNDLSAFIRLTTSNR